MGRIEPKNPIEILEESSNVNFYCIRYLFQYIRYHISINCQKLVQHSLFEAVSLLVIGGNCIILAMDDPTDDEQAKWQETADYIFQALYTLELVLKVLAMGFIFNTGAYMRDPWNIFDFIIVAFGYLPYLNVKLNYGHCDFR